MRRSKRHGFLHPNCIQGKSDRHDAARFKPADALGLDLAEWFRPNAANGFSRIGKPGLIEALRERKGGAAPAWNGMKKGEPAAMAETLATKTLWLPPLLLAGLMALFVVHSVQATEPFGFRNASGHVLTFTVPGTDLVPATVDQAGATQAALDWAQRFYRVGDLTVVDVAFETTPTRFWRVTFSNDGQTGLLYAVVLPDEPTVGDET